jgi:hypothetical protein
LNLLSGCSLLASNIPDYILLEQSSLPVELTETSGLYCPQSGSAFTVNDSGNKSIIYQIDSTGRIIGEVKVDTENTDWEALTGDSHHFYIGDIGNNTGKRKFVQIHAVAKHNKKKLDVETLNIVYAKNSIQQNEYLRHDFDAETLVNVDESLFLFSKSWNTGTLFIYQINKIESEQVVEPVAEIQHLPGMVTGGDYDSNRNQFILVGYKVSKIGGFSPFIAIVNRDLSLHKSFELPSYGQVEAMCVAPNGELWFTQEGSFFSKQKLVKLKLAK